MTSNKFTEKIYATFSFPENADLRTIFVLLVSRVFVLLEAELDSNSKG